MPIAARGRCRDSPSAPIRARGSQPGPGRAGLGDLPGLRSARRFGGGSASSPAVLTVAGASAAMSPAAHSLACPAIARPARRYVDSPQARPPPRRPA